MTTPSRPPAPPRALAAVAAGAALALAGAPAAAASLSLDLGEGAVSLQAVHLLLLLTVLSLAPAILVMVTAFPFLVTVLSILRQALGLQAAPPNMLLIGVALFLTYFVMEPVFARAWTDGVDPLIAGRATPSEAFAAVRGPFEAFMAGRVDPDTLAHLAGLRPDAEPGSLAILLPAFLISEVTYAFQVGFIIFLPFLVIDLVVSAILMSMGMMMVPPAIVALPFKIGFFVLVDGWAMLANALVLGYV